MCTNCSMRWEFCMQQYNFRTFDYMISSNMISWCCTWSDVAPGSIRALIVRTWCVCALVTLFALPIDANLAFLMQNRKAKNEKSIETKAHEKGKWYQKWIQEICSVRHKWCQMKSYLSLLWHWIAAHKNQPCTMDADRDWVHSRWPVQITFYRRSAHIIKPSRLFCCKK